MPTEKSDTLTWRTAPTTALPYGTVVKALLAGQIGTIPPVRPIIRSLSHAGLRYAAATSARVHAPNDHGLRAADVAAIAVQHRHIRIIAALTRALASRLPVSADSK